MTDAVTVLILAGLCDPACDDRAKAMSEGAFLWSPYRHGWVIPPWTRERAGWNGALDLIFVDCPWCGRELPAVEDEADSDPLC